MLGRGLVIIAGEGALLFGLGTAGEGRGQGCHCLCKGYHCRLGACRGVGWRVLSLTVIVEAPTARAWCGGGFHFLGGAGLALLGRRVVGNSIAGVWCGQDYH